ncbi:ATP-binding protein [Pinisolibacter sp.]|uniref:ATP-binding protein n=1 Tax=Pinisolibacter sp. TaxID=2172024 RepID=UPI002FDE2B09
MRAYGSSLAARTMLVLFLGIGAVHLLSLWTYRQALDRETTTADEMRLADRLLTIRRAVMRVEPAEREAVAHDLSGGAIDAHWSRAEHAVAGGPGSADLAGLAEKLRALGDDLEPGDVVIGANRAHHDDPHLAVVSLGLPDRTWINFSLVAQTSRPEDGHGTLLSTSLMALGAIVLSIFMVRWLTRPLLGFVDAARRIYRGGETVMVAEDGPTEIRSLAVAFNEMQRRIKRMIDDRTHALAAVSHDLRTPITRLRLRLGEVESAATRTAISGDLDEMERMIDQTLAYLAGDRDDELVKPVDVAAILATLVDDQTDAGHEVSLDGPRSAVIEGRRLGLKRAFANLIDNAVKYGGRAEIRVTMEADGVMVTIADEGPGVPEDERVRVLDPFVRLEPSRNRDTGGWGLGLPIARRIVESHGGVLELADNEPTGLLVRVRLPARRVDPPTP